MSDKEKKKDKKGQGFLPHWCLYIAWFLCISASITSALFTLFYSMQWGRDKSNQWFVSMVLTFSQDTLINQPAKVLLLSTAYAIFIKKSDEESDLEQSNEDPRKGKNNSSSIGRLRCFSFPGPCIQKMDSAIYRINSYAVDTY